MGLSAWKQHGASRWALRVNPSSGNLHPTETYLVWRRRVYHYAPREHGLEERARLDGAAADLLASGALLVGLTSIHWREAWKYGERAFRYCQHDTGHAIGALRLAAAMLGWQLALLPRWSHGDAGALLGTDRDADFGDAEREEPECVAVVTAGDPSSATSSWLDLNSYLDPTLLAAAARAGQWQGTANRLSPERVEWPIIDEVATATRAAGAALDQGTGLKVQGPMPKGIATGTSIKTAREIILQRRSALDFDPRGVLTREAFLAMLARLQPGAPPWDAIDWPPQVHLALFVHRVQDVAPGIYVYLRDSAALEELKGAMRPEFLWENANAPNAPNDPNLFLLAPLDVRRIANRLSCDQDIAEEGFFSLGMIARVDENLREHGDWFYRRLFWESGVIGQVLYLEAEAAGARATGIGCFYDDPVHDILGLSGHAWQSLYHFSMGLPVDDGRLTAEPGYAWET